MTVSDNPNLIELNIPKYESEKGYTFLMWRYYSMMAGIIADAQSNDDYRIEMLTNFIISSIPDKKLRMKIRNLKSEYINDTLSTLEDPDKPEINAVRVDACWMVMGEVTDFIDESIGVRQKLTVCLEDDEYPYTSPPGESSEDTNIVDEESNKETEDETKDEGVREDPVDETREKNGKFKSL